MPDYKKLYEDLYFGLISLTSEHEAPASVKRKTKTIIRMYKGKAGAHSVIVAHMADGLKNSQIATKMEKSRRTIEGYVFNMCQLYEVKNGTELVAKFFRNGWIK